jgi:hypothetical protein
MVAMFLVVLLTHLLTAMKKTTWWPSRFNLTEKITHRIEIVVWSRSSLDFTEIVWYSKLIQIVSFQMLSHFSYSFFIFNSIGPFSLWLCLISNLGGSWKWKLAQRKRSWVSGSVKMKRVLMHYSAYAPNRRMLIKFRLREADVFIDCALQLTVCIQKPE